MSIRQVWTQYTIQKTTTYNGALPADSPSAWGTDHTQDAFTTSANPTTALGALFTLTATPTAFLGVRAKVKVTYAPGSSGTIELWTYAAAAWTQRATIIVDETVNIHEGVPSGRIRVFDLLLATPLTGVTKVWVTTNGNGGAMTTLIYGCHLYEQVENTSTDDPFDPDTGAGEFVSVRPRGTTPADLAGAIYGALAYTVDLSPEPGDESPGDPRGAWALWDLPALHGFDGTDEEGSDRLVIAIADQLYVLDWEQYQDEWQWDAFAPLYTLVESVAIPSVPDERYGRVRAGEGADPYAPDWRKRFRELRFALADAPTDAMTRYRVTVAEVDVAASARTGEFTTLQTNRAQVVVQGLAFTVTLEHAANERFRVLWWQCLYDVLGKRLGASTVAA